METLLVLNLILDTAAAFALYRVFKNWNQSRLSAFKFQNQRLADAEEAAGQLYLKLESTEILLKMLEANERTHINVMYKQDLRITALEKRLRVKGK